MNFNVLPPAIDGGNTDDCPENLDNPYILQLIRPLLNRHQRQVAALSRIDGITPIDLDTIVTTLRLVCSPSGAASFCAGTSYQGTEARSDGARLNQPLTSLQGLARHQLHAPAHDAPPDKCGQSHRDGDIIIKYADENKGLRVTVTYISIGQAELIGADIYSFLQKEDALKHVNESSVLGLSICKAIVDVLGGEFYMDTEYDKKTVASFWFPCKMRDTQKEHRAFSID